jgi:WD40 repeat protein
MSQMVSNDRPRIFCADPFYAEAPNPHNRNGSLITYNVNGMLAIPTGHQGQKRGIIKHYAVHDVKFDPTRLSFVSTGADRKLRIWSPPDEDEPEVDPNSMDGEPIVPSWRCSTLGTTFGVPHDLAFKPSSSILAVGEK